MWNSGNGSPDAITFSVDKPGILIAGVCVYGGDGQYNYELELMDDVSISSTCTTEIMQVNDHS
jgi:E3 ubiquitin-protein ligase MYCBP2